MGGSSNKYQNDKIKKSLDKFIRHQNFHDETRDLNIDDSYLNQARDYLMGEVQSFRIQANSVQKESKIN